MKLPKILVGCPTSNHKEYCIEEYAEAIKNLTYPNYDILLVDNSQTEEYSKKLQKLGLEVKRDKYLERARERIVHSRNILREYALENNYDYFLSLEQDVIPPKDVLEQLLQHGKEVVTGVYFTKYTIQGKPVLKPLLWKAKGKTLEFVEEEKIIQPQLIIVKASGLGCVLISREVLEKISFRLSEENTTYDDMTFCEDLHKQGISLYADTAIKCKHLITGMNWDVIKE
tara:strand:+ start:1837 stop:2520 length:684 start_codon:yes stop_codon:yes gene_type:complete